MRHETTINVMTIAATTTADPTPHAVTQAAWVFMAFANHDAHDAAFAHSGFVNWLAIVISAIALFLFGWLWYSIFGVAWASALGSTPEAMRAANATNPYPYIVSLVTAFFLAYGLARALSWRGPVSIGRGAFIGFSFGLLFFGMMLWTTYAYEHR